MKSPVAFIIAVIFFLFGNNSIAQQTLLVKAGAFIYVQNGAGIYVAGGFTLENNSSLYNAGTITIARLNVDTADFSDLVSNPYSYGPGKFVLQGAGIQNIRGGIFHDVEINNASGVNLLNDIQINKNLNLVLGSLGISSNTLTLAGTISGNGRLCGSLKSNLQITGSLGTFKLEQSNSSTRSLKDLILTNGASATLADSLSVYGDITLSSASLDLNGKNLTLKSTDKYTARIGDLTGSAISNANNVTVERFIKLRTPGVGYGTGNNGRAYRLLTPTVNTSTSIKYNWMNNEMNPAIGVYINNSPGYGTHITGAGGNANGFDKTQSNESSLYNCSNGLTLGYTAVANTNGTLDALKGYFIYIRGDRGVSTEIPLSINMPTSSTTLRATGTIIQGPVNAFNNAFTGSGSLNLVSNPYPSPIDWQKVRGASSNITDYYTFWNPEIGTRGGFVTVSSSDNGPLRYIQPGQAFFVESNGFGIPSVNIQESHKATGNNNDVFKNSTAPGEAFSTSLYFTEPSGFRRLADNADAWYGSNFNASVDTSDAKEINNWNENIAILREGKRLSIEQRPVIVNRDTIPIFMNNMKQRDYEFEFNPQSFSNTALKAELIDNFLGTRKLLSVIDPTLVAFDVTPDSASWASNRFMIVFGALAPLASDDILLKAQLKNNGVQLDWTSKTENNIDRYEVERSANGLSFSKQFSAVATGNNNLPASYSWLDNTPLQGNNFYRIRRVGKSGEIKLSEIVKIFISKQSSDITVYPNPVIGQEINLRFTNMESGIYQVRLINLMGQTIQSQQLKHVGADGLLISRRGNIAAGRYFLEITRPDGSVLTKEIILM